MPHRRLPQSIAIVPGAPTIPGNADIDTTLAVLRALRNVQPLKPRPLPWRCVSCGRRNHAAFRSCPHCAHTRHAPLEGAGE